jgi:hypothetical protein
MEIIIENPRVGSLPSEREIRLAFGQFGVVENVEFVREKWGPVAYVTMEPGVDAQLVVRAMRGCGWCGTHFNFGVR